MKLRFGAAGAAVLMLIAGLLAPASHAETACESEAAQEYLPPLPRGCQKQRISAAGGMTFGVVQSPERLARKAWEHQVIFFFGERYLDWEKAACKKVFCVRASFAGSRRCHYSAFPCASDTDPAALERLNTLQIAPGGVRGSKQPAARRIEGAQTATGEARSRQPPTAPEVKAPYTATMEARGGEELTGAEIREIQELLSKAGYRIWIDGILGDQTERALGRWQRIRGLADSARPGRASLEALRHYPARGVAPR
jgi:hypothetical protein